MYTYKVMATDMLVHDVTNTRYNVQSSLIYNFLMIFSRWF